MQDKLLKKDHQDPESSSDDANSWDDMNHNIDLAPFDEQLETIQEQKSDKESSARKAGTPSAPKEQVIKQKVNGPVALSDPEVSSETQRGLSSSS